MFKAQLTRLSSSKSLMSIGVLMMIIELQHLSTKEMTSDILTKALDPKPFTHLRTKLLGMLAVCDSHCISRGVQIVSQ